MFTILYCDNFLFFLEMRLQPQESECVINKNYEIELLGAHTESDENRKFYLLLRFLFFC